jgi:murein L,D-transpeptidase YafK
MNSRHIIFSIATGAVLIAVIAYFPSIIPFGDVVTQTPTGRATVDSRLTQYSETSRSRLVPLFKRAKVDYPPQQVVLLGLKEEKRLEIYARNSDSENWKFVTQKPILAASGKMGPKLREGDLQVPEGFYQVESLNPNSAFHLSLRVSYPSAEDKEIAAKEKRTNLGGDIMIHGGAGSVGCIAMGDEVAEDLFVLAAESERENIKIVICPLDFRRAELPEDASRPQWVSKRYEKLKSFCQTLIQSQD